MGIQQICNTIKNLFKKTRDAFPTIPGMLIACGGCDRPGLSALESTANFTVSLSKLGIPTGTMPEGFSNMSVGFGMAQMNETYRALREDAYTQVAFQPGSINFAVGGVFAGVATGTNIGTGKSCAVAN